MGSPIAGSTITMGHTPVLKTSCRSLWGIAAVAMMSATKQIIDKPTDDAIMYARMRSMGRGARGVSFATNPRIGDAQDPLGL
jgi:hypothetical protein